MDSIRDKIIASYEWHNDDDISTERLLAMVADDCGCDVLRVAEVLGENWDSLYVESEEQSMDTGIKKFIEHYKDDVSGDALQYEAGIVVDDKYGFHIGWEQYGAQETFSVGQPVYDENGNIMGYLGIGLFSNLDYSTDRKIRIPVSFWQICLPTQHCKGGKKVFTYWQNKKMAESEGE